VSNTSHSTKRTAFMNPGYPVGGSVSEVSQRGDDRSQAKMSWQISESIFFVPTQGRLDAPNATSIIATRMQAGE
jgi:hypothetical protein